MTLAFTQKVLQAIRADMKLQKQLAEVADTEGWERLILQWAKENGLKIAYATDQTDP